MTGGIRESRDDRNRKQESGRSLAAVNQKENSSMATETLTANDVQDPGVRAELEKALKDNMLTFDEIKAIVAEAISDPDATDAKQLIDGTEYKDLLTLVNKSSTITANGRKHVRQAILINYTQHMLKVGALKTAVQKLLVDSTVTLSEVNDVITEALKDSKLSDDEISDLLALRKGISDPIQRLFLFSVVVWTITGKAPPATPVTATSPIRVGHERSDPLGKYFFEIHVLADVANDPKVTGGAVTRHDLHKSGGEWTTSGGTVTVTKWPRVTKLEIQTGYHSTASATVRSAYGRGTTDADILAKTISLGFHEAQHREEVIKFIKAANIPQFKHDSATIPAGEFRKKLSAFETAFTKLANQMNEKSHSLVDEVGYKLSQFKKDKTSKLHEDMMKKIKPFGWS